MFFCTVTLTLHHQEVRSLSSPLHLGWPSWFTCNQQIYRSDTDVFWDELKRHVATSVPLNACSPKALPCSLLLGSQLWCYEKLQPRGVLPGGTVVDRLHWAQPLSHHSPETRQRSEAFKWIPASSQSDLPWWGPEGDRAGTINPATPNLTSWSTEPISLIKPSLT